MANEYGDGKLVQSAILSSMYSLKVADKAYVGNHPVIAAGYRGFRVGQGSDTMTSSIVDLGSGTASTISETGAIVPDDFDISTYTVQAVRKGKGRNRSDKLAMFDATGVLRDPAALVYDAMSIQMNTLMGLIASVGATLSQDASPGSGTDLDWASVDLAIDTLTQGGVDYQRLLMILHPQQWRDLRAQIRTGTSLSSAFLDGTNAPEALMARPLGYQGSYGNVDIFTSTRVPADGGSANRIGCLLSPGALVWADAPVLPDPHGFVDVLGGGALAIEYQRDASRALKAMYYHFHMGVAIAEDARGVTITSDL